MPQDNDPKRTDATIIVGRYIRTGTDAGPDADGFEYYNGLPIHTRPGLHGHVASVIGDHVGHAGTVIDLASGSGAFVARLRDMGFVPTAVDFVETGFRLGNEVAFRKMDLNTDFAGTISERFDMVTALEIIEHLENPRNFLRQAAQLCKPGSGKLVLTTPNVENPVSKAMFCRDGSYMWFDEESYHEMGHITPIGPSHIRRIVEEIGLFYLYEGSFGDPFDMVGHRSRLADLARSIQRASKSGPETAGEIYVAVLGQKT